MTWILRILCLLITNLYALAFSSSRVTFLSPSVTLQHLYSTPSFIEFVGFDDDDSDEDEEDDDNEDIPQDPYTSAAASEFTESSALTTLDSTVLDWGGALGTLRQRMQDVESGQSQDPSHVLFRLMSKQTPNQIIGKFVMQANPQVVQAMSGAVGSLLGGLSSNPASGVETIVKASGEKIGSLCFQLQMTGYVEIVP